jgi:hypothetical protein
MRVHRTWQLFMNRRRPTADFADGLTADIADGRGSEFWLRLCIWSFARARAAVIHCWRRED